MVVCIFSLVGFEAASTMGGEARNPLRNVPKAVIWSLIITGLFMVVMCYVETLGAKHPPRPRRRSAHRCRRSRPPTR